MSRNAYKDRKQRERLFREQGGLCYWCKVPMSQPSRGPDRHKRKNFADNEATLDHLDSRLSPTRRQRCDGELRHVVACRRCNEQRGKEEQAALPREELWRRSGSYPLVLTLEALLELVPPGNYDIPT